MTTLTVKIADDKDLPVLKEILSRFRMNYFVDQELTPQFSQVEIDNFFKAKDQYISGKTTARDWKAIDEELDSAYN